MTNSETVRSETPSEYIRQIKRAYPPRENDTATIPPVLKELLAENEEGARKSLEALPDLDYAHLLLEHLMSGLPDLFTDLFEKGIVAVGEVNDSIPNAMTIRLDGPSYAVVFNAGLQRFLYRITRVLSTRFQSQGSEGSLEGLSFEESCRILTDVFFWYRETGQAGGPDYPLTQFQLTIASTIATEAESFFLAHELGHVFNDLRALAKNVTREERAAAWADEVEADRFALSALINSRNHKDAIVPVEICYAGAEIALSVLSGLERLGEDFGNSHPPSGSRLDAIRNHLRGLCVDDASFDRITVLSKPLDLLFTQVVDRLASPDWESFLDRAATDVMKELDQLLDRCTGGMVPDYFYFRSNASLMFDRLSSHRLYARVAHAAADFARHMQTMNKEAGDATKHDAWVSFQKYKLFMSMIRDMNEPFRSLLEEALGIPT